MVNFIDKNESLDYVNLPENFDIRFGADVFRLCFLKKILDEFKEDKNKEIKFRFNPWGYAELYPEKFNMITFKDVPVYDKKRFKETKDLVAKVWPDRFDHSSNPIFPYHQARQFLDDQKIALDVACGLGSGSVYLAEHAKKVLGIDISEEAIAHCKKKYEDLRNVEFIKKDIYDLNFDSGYFDLIISIHTLEHLPDEKGFLNRVHYWLKPGGIVIIEVPLKKESPFKGIVEPFRKGHIREYESQEFIKLLNDYFIIEKSFGVVRNFYAEIKKARDSVMIIARKK